MLSFTPWMQQPEQLHYKKIDRTGNFTGVEMSFNKQIAKFKHADYLWSHKILQAHDSNWEYLRMLWDLQVLMFNLFMCAQGQGSQA